MPPLLRDKSYNRDMPFIKYFRKGETLPVTGLCLSPARARGQPVSPLAGLGYMPQPRVPPAIGIGRASVTPDLRHAIGAPGLRRGTPGSRLPGSELCNRNSPLLSGLAGLLRAGLGTRPDP
ncbi:hypothetical protein XINFAN_03338 [Pseudogemmobacter humi]|uniref:Uncharacterized protein n=1 Tax=Pseudogemmobacter humi TaxID=2483812 RepID=A0A3P5XC10_9RHOB|nr:hypothetical protein XINFAN_03338 [Pseudogemmobacter humi]